ncbi:hypothetical protein GCM10020001_008920 [Nonomuraea salmonea]
MIDFRYHLVSIVAIFLALAVGIVLGTTLLQEPAVKSAQELTAQLTKTKEELRAQIDTLQGREAGNDAFISAVTPELVAGDLAGQRVLLIETPGSNTAWREAAQQVLDQAGAEVTGRVTFTEKFLDPKGTGVLDGLVNQLKPVNMVFPETATSWGRAAALLGASLVTNDTAQAGTPNTTTADVVGAFEAGGLLTVDGDPAKRATLAVMFAPERPYEGGAPRPRRARSSPWPTASTRRARARCWPASPPPRSPQETSSPPCATRARSPSGSPASIRPTCRSGRSRSSTLCRSSCPGGPANTATARAHPAPSPPRRPPHPIPPTTESGS